MICLLLLFVSYRFQYVLLLCTIHFTGRRYGATVGQPSVPTRRSSDHRSGTPSYIRPARQLITPADRRLLLKPGRCTNNRSSASARDESSDTLYSEASQIRDALSQNSDAQHAGIAHLTANDERAPVVQNSRHYYLSLLLYITALSAVL